MNFCSLISNRKMKAVHLHINPLKVNPLKVLQIKKPPEAHTWALGTEQANLLAF